MKYWNYIIADSNGEMVANYTGTIIKKEQEARKAAIEKMRTILMKLTRQDNPAPEAPPFTLELTFHDNPSYSLPMGKERYTEKEIMEYGKGGLLSFGELMSLAKDNWSKGGDGIYECWDQRTFDDYIKEAGPISREDAFHLFALMAGC